MSEELAHKHCPQCEMPVLDTDVRCPFCGRTQPGFVVSPARWLARIGSILLLLVVGLPAALLGLCFLSAIGSGTGSVFVLVLACGAALALTIWAVVASWRR